MSTFAAPANALPMLPVFTFTASTVFALRIAPKRLPLPGRSGVSFHFTFSCAAAWIALYSCGETTARKLPLRTICTSPRCLIELSSTETGVGVTP